MVKTKTITTVEGIELEYETTECDSCNNEYAVTDTDEWIIKREEETDIHGRICHHCREDPISWPYRIREVTFSGIPMDEEDAWDDMVGIYMFGFIILPLILLFGLFNDNEITGFWHGAMLTIIWLVIPLTLYIIW